MGIVFFIIFEMKNKKITENTPFYDIAEDWMKKNKIKIPPRDSQQYKIYYEKWAKFAFKNIND